MHSKPASQRNARKTSPAPYLRPSESVREYLKAEFERPELTDGSRLPTIRQLAARLNVSTRTVQSVLQQLSREGRIRTEVGNGTFLVAASRTSPRDECTVALGAPVPQAALSPWFYPIYGGILHATTRAQRVMKLLAWCRREDGDADARRKLLEGCSQVDGLILFASSFSDEVRRIYEGNGKPVIDLNPPAETATANFVAPDYFCASSRLGRAWRETGRRQIVLLLHMPLERSVSNRLRWAGLANGLGSELGRSIACRITSTGGAASEENGYQAMREVLQSREGPVDAVYCIGDYLALGAIRALREQGRRIPSEVSVVGGSGLDLSRTTWPGLTRTQQPLEQMGESLVALLEERIRLNGLALPGRVLPTPFVGGMTTRADENALLGMTRSAAPDATARPFSPLDEDHTTW